MSETDSLEVLPKLLSWEMQSTTEERYMFESISVRGLLNASEKDVWGVESLFQVRAALCNKEQEMFYVRRVLVTLFLIGDLNVFACIICNIL